MCLKRSFPLLFVLFILPITVRGGNTNTIIRQGNITFEFSGVSQSGEYLDKIAWVYGENIELIKTTPIESYFEDKHVHGVTLNPKSSASTKNKIQYWDGRISSYGTSPPSYPIKLKTNDIIVKAHCETSGITGFRHGVIRQYGAVVVVDQAPPKNAMAPALIGWKDRTEFAHHTVDIEKILASLPNYSSTGLELPDFNSLMVRFDQLNLGFSFTTSCSPSSGYEAHMPFLFGDVRKKPSNYGRYTAKTIGSAALAMICDGYSKSEKRAIAIRMLQHGIQWFDTLENSVEPIHEDGGHIQFHHIPVVCALLWTGRGDELNKLVDKMPGNLIGQPLVVDQDLLNNLKPHDDGLKPGISRRRILASGSINGTTIQIPTKRQSNRYDPYRLQVKNMFLTRETDGAKALVVDMPDGKIPKSNSDSSLSIEIDTHPSPPFAAGDVVFFTAGYPIHLGDYDWTVRKIYPNWFRPNEPVSYRDLNFWVEEYIFFKSIKLGHPSLEPMYGYVKRANLPDNPTQKIDFPPHYDGKFAKSFWYKHGFKL